MGRLTSSLLESRRLHIAAFVAITGALAVMLVQALRKAYRADGYDLTSYLLSAQALLDGSNPYLTNTPFPYIYPLFLAFIAVPLASIPYWMANLVWYSFSVASMTWSYVAVNRMAFSDIKVGLPLAIPGFLTLLVMFSPVQSNFLNGQVNLIVLACCVAFCRCFICKQKALSAIWLATAIALKLVPAILLGFLLVRREFRLSIAVLGLTTFFCLVPWILAGDRLFAYYEFYVDSFLWRGIHGLGGGETTGFDLQSMLTHFVPSSDSSLLTKVIGVCLPVVLLLSVDLTVVRSSEPRGEVWGFSAYLVGALLISPLGEVHHLVLAIPAVSLLTARAIRDGTWRSRRGTRFLFALFILSIMLLPKLLNERSVFFVPLVLLLGLLLLAVQRQPSTK